MNRRVTAGAPACALLQVGCVIGVTNVDLALGCATPLDLRMTFQAKVGIALDEHFAVD